MREAAATYVDTLNKMSALEGDAGMPTDRPRNWNRLAKKLQAAREELVTTAAGREFISSLLDDPRATVR